MQRAEWEVSKIAVMAIGTVVVTLIMIAFVAVA